MTTTIPVVAIMLDGKPFATRHWAVIPRLGETLTFQGGEVWAEVEHVLWADDTHNPPAGQWVQLWCKSCPPPGAPI